MVPESERHVAFAHWLRGIAALTVLLHHYLTFLYSPLEGVANAINMLPAVPLGHSFVRLLARWQTMFEPLALDPRMWGNIGVGLFFLISGFVIPFSVARNTRRGFLLGRLIRLWPTYAVSLATVLLMLLLAAHRSGWPLRWDGWDIIRHLLLVQDITNGSTLDLVSWSLAVEVAFYLFCALIAPQLRGEAVVPLVILAFFSAVLATSLPFFVWSREGLPLVVLARYLSLLPYLLIGTLLYFHYRGLVGTGRLIGYAAALFFLFIGSRSLIDMGQPRLLALDAAYLYALLLFTLAYALRDRIALLPLWFALPFDGLAAISYPLYIVHAIHGYVLINLLCEWNIPLLAIVSIATAWSLCVATALHWLVERPTHAWARRVMARYQVVPPQPRYAAG